MSNNDTLITAATQIQQGNLAHANKILQEYVAQHPEDAEGWYLISRTYTDNTYSIEALDKALLNYPDHARAKALREELVTATKSASLQNNENVGYPVQDDSRRKTDENPISANFSRPDTEATQPNPSIPVDITQEDATVRPVSQTTQPVATENTSTPINYPNGNQTHPVHHTVPPTTPARQTQSDGDLNEVFHDGMTFVGAQFSHPQKRSLWLAFTIFSVLWFPDPIVLLLLLFAAGIAKAKWEFFAKVDEWISAFSNSVPALVMKLIWFGVFCGVVYQLYLTNPEFLGQMIAFVVVGLFVLGWVMGKLDDFQGTSGGGNTAVPDIPNIGDQGKIWLDKNQRGKPSLVYQDGKIWDNPQMRGKPIAVYENGKVWFSDRSRGKANAVYDFGKIWFQDTSRGKPNAVYQDGHAWLGDRPNGKPLLEYKIDGIATNTGAILAVIMAKSR